MLAILIALTLVDLSIIIIDLLSDIIESVKNKIDSRYEEKLVIKKETVETIEINGTEIVTINGYTEIGYKLPDEEFDFYVSPNKKQAEERLKELNNGN